MAAIGDIVLADCRIENPKRPVRRVLPCDLAAQRKGRP